MIIFAQSYASPSIMEADNDIFQILKNFINIKTLFVSAEKVRLLNFKETILLGRDCVKKSKNGDLIFGWGGDICLYAWVFANWTSKRLSFLSQNLIVNPENSKTSLRGCIRYHLYRRALNSKNFNVTVNSPSLIEYYSKMFHCPTTRFHLVYDSMKLSGSEYKAVKKKHRSQPYVFFGGKTFRDTETFLKIVRRLPKVKFRAAILKSMVTPEMGDLNNLEVFCDLEKKEFYNILREASVCCIPLNAVVPCGLYVMQHAILMGIPIVSTDTPSMRTIVPNDNCGFLLQRGDDEGMARRIEDLLGNEKLSETVTNAASVNMQHFTPKAVGRQLCDVLKTLTDRTK